MINNKPIDITQYIKDNQVLKAYGGANGNKVAVNIDGKVYMIKFPPKKANIKETSYTNSSISEHIGSSIFNMAGLEAQKTFLASAVIDNKEKLCVACEDFETKDWKLYEFSQIKNTCIESSLNGYGVEIDEVLNAIQEQKFFPAKELETFFWKLFIMDAFLGNFDRHNGNWGILINEQTSETKIAPVFDCGSCLYPQLTDEGIKDILLKMDEIDKRIYVFPNAALKEDNQKINYYDFLCETSNIECLKAILDTVPTIDMKSIENFINDVSYISNERKNFYNIMLSERYEKILIPALEHAKEKLIIQDYSISKRVEKAKQTVKDQKTIIDKKIEKSIDK